MTNGMKLRKPEPAQAKPGKTAFSAGQAHYQELTRRMQPSSLSYPRPPEATAATITTRTTSGAYPHQYGSSHTTVYSPQPSPVPSSAKATAPIRSKTETVGNWNIFEPPDGRKSPVQSQISISNGHRTSREYDQRDFPTTYDHHVQPQSIYAAIPATPSTDNPDHPPQSVVLHGITTPSRLPQSEPLHGTISPPDMNDGSQNDPPLSSVQPSIQEMVSAAMEVDTDNSGGRAVDTVSQYIADASLDSQMPLQESYRGSQPGAGGIDVGCQTEDRLSQRPPSYTTVNNSYESQGSPSPRIGRNVDMDLSSPLHDSLKAPPRKPVPNILVFGETGTGKSSLINMIAGSDVAGVSGEALGHTFDSIAYGVNVDGVPMTIWDTAGLNEGDNGTVAAQQAVFNLHKLVHNLRNEGVHLLVYCIRGTRFRDVLRANYEIFHLGICQGIVPVVIVITGLEHEDPMERWWEINRNEFSKHRMEFCGHACVTTSKGKKLRSGDGYMFDEEYAFSQAAVRELIKEHCSPNPVKMDELSMQTIVQTLRGCYRDAQADVARGGERAASGISILRILEGLLQILFNRSLGETGQLVR